MRIFSIYLFLYDGLHVSDGVSFHHQEHKTAHTASGMLLLPAASLARLAAGSNNGLTDT